MTDAYVPKTAAGKAAVESGADLAIVQAQEESGELTDAAVVEQPGHVQGKKEGEGGAADDGQGGAELKPGDEGYVLKPGDEGYVEKEQPNRVAQTIPVWKHKEEVKKATEELRKSLTTEFEQKLATAAGKPGGATEADVTKIAEEFGLKPEVATAMLDRFASAIQSRIQLPAEATKALESIKERERQEQEAAGYDTEWGSQETQEALTAAAGGKEITPAVKAKVRELAYTTTYSRYALADIVRLNAGTLFPSGKASAEVGRGGAGRGKALDINELSPEQILALPQDEFDALSEKLGGSGSRFTRTTVPRKPRKNA